MIQSRTEPARAAPAGAGRGAVVEFTLRRGGTGTGTVTSACVPASGRPQLTIRDGAGARYTRLAAGVRVITPAPAGAPGPGPARGFGQQAGQPAPNGGRRHPAEVLTTAEVGAILGRCSRRAPTGIRNRAMLTLLYRSGLRVGELLALRPADVDQDAHTLRLLDTKSGHAQTRGYHPDADDALARWADTRRQLGLSRRGRLFCTLAGAPVSDDYVRGMLRRLAARAEVGKRAHPHGLRHTFAAELERAGTPVTTISRLLGHSSVAVTARYLQHLTNGQAIAELERAQLPPLPPAPAAQPVRPPGRPARPAGRVPDPAAAPEPEPAAAPAPPPRRREPRITRDTGYELARAADHAETGAWLVMAGGTQVGRVSRTWEGTGTAVWQATSNAGARARCAGKGATRDGNARTRDRAAAELMMMLMRVQRGTRANR